MGAAPEAEWCWGVCAHPTLTDAPPSPPPRGCSVEAEWHLERKERSPYLLGLELLLSLIFAWQLVEVWQVLGPNAWSAATAAVAL